MWPARYRAAHAVTPLVESHRDISDTVGILCTKDGCERCAQYDTELGARTHFEHSVLGISRVYEWDCSSGRHRDEAMYCGVTELPVYLILAPRPGVSVVLKRPPVASR